MRRLIALGLVKSPHKTKDITYAVSDSNWKPQLPANYEPPFDDDLVRKIKLESNDEI